MRPSRYDFDHHDLFWIQNPVLIRIQNPYYDDGDISSGLAEMTWSGFGPQRADVRVASEFVAAVASTRLIRPCIRTDAIPDPENS